MRKASKHQGRRGDESKIGKPKMKFNQTSSRTHAPVCAPASTCDVFGGKVVAEMGDKGYLRVFFSTPNVSGRH